MKLEQDHHPQNKDVNIAINSSVVDSSSEEDWSNKNGFIKIPSEPGTWRSSQGPSTGKN
jgi:hypothetical protein